MLSLVFCLAPNVPLEIKVGVCLKCGTIVEDFPDFPLLATCASNLKKLLASYGPDAQFGKDILTALLPSPREMSVFFLGKVVDGTKTSCSWCGKHKTRLTPCRSCSVAKLCMDDDCLEEHLKRQCCTEA